MKHVIVGAGPAGVIAAETLRKIDPEALITLIGDEPEEPYSRMAIPYLLIENIDVEGTYLRKSAGYYDLNGIDILKDRVTGVEPGERRLHLLSGGVVSYDRLLLATGSRPIKPPVPGVDLPGVVNCWTLADARQILERSGLGAKVVLIGAGFIGAIILEALVKRGADLAVVEMDDRMVPRMMNEVAGNMIKSWCRSKGVEIYTSNQIVGIQENPLPQVSGGLRKMLRAVGFGQAPRPPAHPLAAELKDGTRLEADLIITAAGVLPNMEFLQNSGVEMDRGILIDHFMQSNIGGIYAAGDVAQGRDFSTGQFQVHAIQPTASEHGRIAAFNMAGVPTPYEGSFNMNVLDTLGLISSSFGLWMGVESGESVERVDEELHRYINLQFKDDLMVGATTLGLTQHVGVLRGLIQGKVHLGKWKDRLLEDPSRVMEAYLACNHLSRAA